MQPYRYVRPHDAAACQVCAPTGGGHALCQKPGCDEVAVAQTRRHATQAEYDALPEQLVPIDGVAHMIVLACDDHAEAAVPFCAHPEPTEVPCPTCKAEGDAPCVEQGASKVFRHRARWDAQQVEQPCTHAHREDCDVFDGCQCTDDDPDPQRTPRPRGVTDQADGRRSKLPWVLVKPLVEAHDVPWWTVREYATLQAQDTKSWEIQATYATLDADGNLVHDEHGHEVTGTLTIPVDPSAPPPRPGGVR
jgi:hypothetical protein